MMTFKAQLIKQLESHTLLFIFFAILTVFLFDFIFMSSYYPELIMQLVSFITAHFTSLLKCIDESN